MDDKADSRTDYTLPQLSSLLLSRISRVYESPDLVKTEARRILHGRGRLWPGFDDINIDLFPPLVFVTLYRNYTDEDVEYISLQADIVFPGQPQLIQDRSRRPGFIRLTRGKIPEEFTVTEGELEFYINPSRGQNPGFFHDMREGRAVLRRMIGEMDAGIRVLNLFAYTCSLSVTALAAGASKVINIDMNRRSLEIGKQNHRLNHDRIPGGYRNQALFLPHDIFKSFGRLKKEGPYNIIIADPPPSQKGSFMFQKDYPKLLRRLPEMLYSEGKLFLTHNGPGSGWEEFSEMIHANLHDFKISKTVEPPEDFHSREPGRGLKIIICDPNKSSSGK